jgi:hypothetical protein
MVRKALHHKRKAAARAADESAHTGALSPRPPPPPPVLKKRYANDSELPLRLQRKKAKRLASQRSTEVTRQLDDQSRDGRDGRDDVFRQWKTTFKEYNRGTLTSRLEVLFPDKNEFDRVLQSLKQHDSRHMKFVYDAVMRCARRRFYTYDLPSANGRQ